MKNIEINVRKNVGYSNINQKINVNVDEKLYEILSTLENGNCSSEMQMFDSCFYVKKQGVMSQDKGFKIVDIDSNTYGNNMGMFYCGIPKGSEYVELSYLQNNGTYKYEDLLRVV